MRGYNNLKLAKTLLQKRCNMLAPFRIVAHRNIVKYEDFEFFVNMIIAAKRMASAKVRVCDSLRTPSGGTSSPRFMKSVNTCAALWIRLLSFGSLILMGWFGASGPCISWLIAWASSLSLSTKPSMCFTMVRSIILACLSRLPLINVRLDLIRPSLFQPVTISSNALWYRTRRCTHVRPLAF